MTKEEKIKKINGKLWQLPKDELEALYNKLFPNIYHKEQISIVEKGIDIDYGFVKEVA